MLTPRYGLYLIGIHTTSVGKDINLKLYFLDVCRMVDWKPGVYRYMLLMKSRLSGDSVVLDNEFIGNYNSVNIDYTDSGTLYTGDTYLVTMPKCIVVPGYDLHKIPYMVNPFRIARNAEPLQRVADLPTSDERAYILVIDCQLTHRIVLVLIHRTNVKI